MSLRISFSITMIYFPSEGLSQRSFLPGSSGSHPQGESWNQCFQSSDMTQDSGYAFMEEIPHKRCCVLCALFQEAVKDPKDHSGA